MPFQLQLKLQRSQMITLLVWLLPTGLLFSEPPSETLPLPYPSTASPAPVFPSTPPNTLPTNGAYSDILLPNAAPTISTEVIPESTLELSEPILEISEPIVPEEVVWYQPSSWFVKVPWDTGIELGLNGSSGTSDSFSMRTGGYIKRESKFSKLDMSAYYNKTSANKIDTQNNAQFDVRNDWLLDESSPWTLFAMGTVFYDEFQMFDLQVNANSGIGYQFVDVAGISMLGRVGAGGSREFGGPDDSWVPEALLGFEYEQQISASQKLYGRLDYYPEFEDFTRYRLVADVGWEVELDRPSNLSLKISATDRFDSTPNGVDPHLINYSVLLLLKL